ncbi:respiratory nitrate reductase subunit gamma [candidate division KSB1 bacterium]
MLLLQLFTYISIVFFLIFVVKKAIKYASMPVHLRWELYPVAHEPERAKYGGSYYEDVKFWEKKAEKSHLLEFVEMFEEIVFLKGIFVHNRPLWLFSFPFHFGLYMLIVAFGLITTGAIFEMAGTAVATGSPSFIAGLLYTLTIIAGYAGIALTIIGSIGLIFKRLSDENLKLYNSPADYINLIIILLVASSLLFSGLKTDFSTNRAFIISLLTFDSTIQLGTGFIVHVILTSILLIYLPLTRMTHFVAKYFTYHQVRWDDELNTKGSKLQKKIVEALNFGVSWSAPHIQTGKTWAEVATEIPTEENNEK